MPFFIPFKGCPFKCIYCDQTAISGCDGIRLEEALSDFGKDHKNEDYSAQVAFFGGTFSLLDMDEQKRLIEISKSFIDKGVIHGIRFSTRPDALNDKMLQYYSKNCVQHIELGVQSLNDKYLLMLRRGYKASIVKPVIGKIKSYGIKAGAQMMMGFPGQTKDEFLEDIRKVILTGPSDCRIYPLTVLKGTALEKIYYEKELKFMDMDTAVEWVSEATMAIENAGIEIRRIGLPHSVELQKNVVAGLYHPSFADKVRYKMLKDSIDKIILKSVDVILVHPSDLQYANRINRFKNLKNKILPDKDIERSKVAILH